MFLRMVYDDKLAEAAYVIGCQRTGEAIVIDPQRDVDRYEKLAAANGLRIVAAAETLQDGQVILMHDGYATTIAAIPRIVESLAKRRLRAGMIGPATGRAVEPRD
jgi:peptidoglycan/xylan/chitin deacetylase (PgdA/CDA1 family)